jgi:UDP-3-O-[3-hydroxymyristoyl] glucosamine N-acyltransferase
MPADQDRRPRTLRDIARTVEGRLIGPSDAAVTGAASLADASEGDLSYVDHDRHLPAATLSRAAAFVVSRKLSGLTRPQIVVANPKYAFARIVQQFFTAPYAPRGIAADITRGQDVEVGADVSIWPFVTLGDRVRIGARVTLYPGVFIGHDTVIGDDSILYPNVTVREQCSIGRRVTIHSGTVIGSDGFGYVQHDGHHHKIPQIGSVVIEDDVELGANVSVDRATVGRTLIKRGTKVDNLVQIAHNVTIGEHSIVVAQVGIAGSTTVGSNVMMGGQAGVADHLDIGDHVIIAAQAGVNRSVTGGQIVSGAPAIPHEISIKAQAVISRLPELRQHVRALEKRVKALETRRGRSMQATKSKRNRRRSA